MFLIKAPSKLSRILLAETEQLFLYYFSFSFTSSFLPSCFYYIIYTGQSFLTIQTSSDAENQDEYRDAIATYYIKPNVTF